MTEVKIKIKFKTTEVRVKASSKLITEVMVKVRSKLVTNQGHGELKTNHRRYGQSVFIIS